MVESRQPIDQRLPLLFGELARVEITQGEDQRLANRRFRFFFQAAGENSVVGSQASQSLDQETPQRRVLTVREQRPYARSFAKAQQADGGVRLLLPNPSRTSGFSREDGD